MQMPAVKQLTEFLCAGARDHESAASRTQVFVGTGSTSVFRNVDSLQEATNLFNIILIMIITIIYQEEHENVIM
jgi:hypothetical protein